MSLRVEPVEHARGRRLFRDLPERLYGEHPAFVPPLRIAFDSLLDRRKNPFWRHAVGREWLAWRGNEPVGRIGACKDSLLEERAPGTGVVGFYESADDPEVSAALFGAAQGWLEERGLARARGPLNYSIHDTAGLLVEGFDTPPAVDTTWNPAYYPTHWEAGGWERARDLLGCAGAIRKEGVERVARVAEIARRRGVTSRFVDLARFGEDAEILRQIFNTAWDDNWGHVPLGKEEFELKTRDMKSVIDPKTIVLAEKGGRPVGILLGLPDLNVAARRCGGKLFPFGWWHLLRAKRGGRLRIVLLGVVPGSRVRGIEALLLQTCYEGMAGRYDWSETSWVLEDNAVMLNALALHNMLPYKRWRLYEKVL